MKHFLSEQGVYAILQAFSIFPPLPSTLSEIPRPPLLPHVSRIPQFPYRGFCPTSVLLDKKEEAFDDSNDFFFRISIAVNF